MNANKDFEKWWKEETEEIFEKTGVNFQDSIYYPNLEKSLARKAYERGVWYHSNMIELREE